MKAGDVILVDKFRAIVNGVGVKGKSDYASDNNRHFIFLMLGLSNNDTIEKNPGDILNELGWFYKETDDD